MTLNLVTLQEAKQFCRIDGDEEDAVLTVLIGAASAAAIDHANGWTPTAEVPDRIKLAVLSHIARAYTDREDGADAPQSAGRLLFPLRKLDV